MPGPSILILGGTAQANRLATMLVDAGYDLTTSLAGVTRQPALPAGKLRQGGFGGSDGLRCYIEQNDIKLLVDATHAFAAQISANAATAARLAKVPLLRLELPAWQPSAGDRWTAAKSVAEAAAMLPEGARIFLTIGRKDIAPFTSRPGLSGLARMIEPPAVPMPLGWTLLLARPPFSIAHEIDLMKQHGITHLVTKNAGGGSTEAKLEAARSLALPVIMIERPSKPADETLASPEQIAKRIQQIFCS